MFTNVYYFWWFIFFFKFREHLKVTTLLGASIKSFPVEGFLPLRLLFSFTQNLPKPLTNTSSPDSRLFLMCSRMVSTISDDLFFGYPVCSAMASTIWAFVRVIFGFLSLLLEISGGIGHVPDQTLPAGNNPFIWADRTFPINLTGSRVQLNIQGSFARPPFWPPPAFGGWVDWNITLNGCGIGYDFSELFYLRFELRDSRAGLSFIKPVSNIDNPHGISPFMAGWRGWDLYDLYSFPSFRTFCQWNLMGYGVLMHLMLQ